MDIGVAFFNKLVHPKAKMNTCCKFAKLFLFSSKIAKHSLKILFSNFPRPFLKEWYIVNILLQLGVAKDAFYRLIRTSGTFPLTNLHSPPPCSFLRCTCTKSADSLALSCCAGHCVILFRFSLIHVNWRAPKNTSLLSKTIQACFELCIISNLVQWNFVYWGSNEENLFWNLGKQLFNWHSTSLWSSYLRKGRSIWINQAQSRAQGTSKRWVNFENIHNFHADESLFRSHRTG